MRASFFEILSIPARQANTGVPRPASIAAYLNPTGTGAVIGFGVKQSPVGIDRKRRTFSVYVSGIFKSERIRQNFKNVNRSALTQFDSNAILCARLRSNIAAKSTGHRSEIMKGL